MWWNPAVEAQAIDRTHRIGQHRTVIAYRMLTTGTIEEKIWELQTRKASLAKEVLGEDGFAKALTRGDLEYLLDAPAGASPRGPGVPGRRGGPP
jgi:SNF2 family DNA or RNA helicase